MEKQAVLKIYGRVQGVFYRDSARRKAKKMGLAGWAQNQADGSVKIVAQGEEQTLKEFVDWCYNGPILAKVDEIETEWSKPEKKLKNFEIRY